MKRLAFLLIAFLAVCFSAIAQLPTTNTWITDDQPYFRLPIIEDGIHRVSKSDLKAMGAPTETIANDFYKIYEHGKEIPLNVTSEYIEFYAERAKGDLDSLLYEKSSDQLGTSYSLYTDTAYYYLTYGNTKGLRFTAQNNTNITGLSQIESFDKTVYHHYNSNYELGERIYPSLQHPAYGAGDCWVSERISRNSSVISSMDLNDLKPGTDGTFKTTVVGSNNRTADAAKYDGFNNQAIVDLNNGSWQEKERLLFNGFTRHDIELNFNSSDLNKGTLEYKIWHDRTYNGIKNAFNGIYNIAQVEVNYRAVPRMNNGTSAIIELPPSANDQFIEIDNALSSNYVILDSKNKWILNYTIQNGKIIIRIPASTIGYKMSIIDQNQTHSVTPRKAKIFRTELSSEIDFLIITNKVLKSSAEQYASFRSSIQGGGFKVKVAYVDEIFNEYYFGYHHPLAIKLYLKSAIESCENLNHVLLLGKGLNPQFLKTSGIFDVSNDLVPSIGSPCSDWYYGYKIDDDKMVAPFSIGRISATSNNDVLNYLNKLKSYERLGTEGWRKDVVHISGGKSGSELTRFANYMRVLGDIIEAPSVGANVNYYGKEKGLVVDEDLKTVILQQVNKGTGFFSYFGHAALNVTEVDIGIPIEYNNADKPIVMYFGGCVLGGCYEQNGSLGEDFIDSETGAITWMAASTFSFETSVFDFTKTWYEELSGPNYGESFGEIGRSTIEKFIGEGGDLYKEAQAWQMIIQGDPAIKLYNPDLPDYQVTNNDIFITPEGVTAQSDSFYVNVIIKNAGRAVEEKLLLNYNLKFPDGSSLSDSSIAKNVFNTDTFRFTIYNTNNLFGKHNIEIELDPNNSIAELLETNNKASFDFLLFSNGSVGLFPPSFGIVNNTEMELVGQSLDLNSTNNIFQFEIDTTPNFKSQWRKKSGDLKGTLVRRWKVNLLETDSQDYYWRLRLKTDDGYSPWTTRSFSYIDKSLEGWAQIDFKQLQSAAVYDLYGDTLNESYNFYRFTAPGQIIVQNHGRDFPEYRWYRFGDPANYRDSRKFISNTYRDVDGWASLNGMCVYVFEPHLNEEETFNSWSLDMGKKVYNRVGEMRFDWMKSETEVDPEIIDSFISCINQIPEGYHVLMYSGFYHRIGDMPNRFYEAVESVGSAKIRKVQNNGVWLIAGTKGARPGRAHDEQYTTKQDSLLESSITLTVVKSEGKLISQQIGPSKKWRSLTLKSIGINEPTDLVDNSYNLIVIDTAGTKTVLLDNFIKSNLDLSFIDANRYPYLQIELNTLNKKTYQPAKPLRWIVNYDYLPEGLISTQVAYKFNSDTLQKGQELEFEIGYENVSNLSLDPIPIQYEIVDKNRAVKINKRDTLKALAPGESSVIKGTFSSSSLINENKLVIRTNPDGSIPELYSFNNNFEKAFFVEGDKEKPTLEVTIDGYRILDGDIVSPKPSIAITGVDNNSFFLLDKPEHFEIYLEKRDSGTVKIDQSTPGFLFFPANKENRKAKVEYNPNWLDDGEYTLTVQLVDGSGNRSGVSAYEVNFEVVGKSSITNFYPYPNPFSTQMRFVFTLTGDREPDDIIIQIMTVTGKVVKEIHKSELGALKIGQNTSAFAWDGTDMYGNKLANGLYLYRVKTVIDGKQVELRSSQGDNSFKEGFGKIYILR